tara:strand:- start:84 stop:332 length:249 start_codon:yes stop_codon:yes gene_type:complete
MKFYSIEEISKHNTENECWVIIKNEVYNVTDFLDEHPGGKKAIMLYAGKDATEEYEMIHNPSIIKKYGKDYHIGRLNIKSKL